MTALLSIAASCGAAHAQEFPTRPVRVVTATIGGTTDLVARVIAQGLTASHGQQVIVDNPRRRTPEQFAAAINAEIASMGKVIRAAGIRTE